MCEYSFHITKKEVNSNEDIYIYIYILITSHLCNKQGTETEHVNNGEGKITCLT
jgi:hypothetical protein